MRMQAQQLLMDTAVAREFPGILGLPLRSDASTPVMLHSKNEV